MVSKVKITYCSRPSKSSQSLPSPLSVASPPTSRKRKRGVEDKENNTVSLSSKTSKKRSQTSSKPLKQKALTQLHFSIDNSVLRTCALCGLSYTKGAPDDESLHRSHCARVQRGMEWGREEEREKLKASVQEIRSGVRLNDGKKGRIVCVKADVGGKVGAKITALLETISLALTSPPLTPTILRNSKVYLFLVPSVSSSREKIVGCVVAQRIKTAMAIVANDGSKEIASNAGERPVVLVSEDPSSAIYCHPDPLPTPLGIPRLFVSSAHRRQGIASHLLTTAAQNFIHACPLDPRKGEVAFTQPTGLGAAVMQKWGSGGVRVYQE